MPGHAREAERFPLAGAFGLYTIAFLALAWPWLSGAVEIPYDAASQFYPQLAFLARSFATGQSPFWTPNIFAGWPQIADPQSLIFSPLHLIVALLVPKPKPVARRRPGVRAALCRRRGRDPVFPRPRLACRRRAGGGAGVLRSAARRRRASSTSARSKAWCSCRCRCGCWRARSSARPGAPARARACSPRLIVLGRDQVSLIAVYVLTGFVLWHWLQRTGPAGADRGEREAARWRARSPARLIVTVPVTLTALLAMHSNRPEIGYAFAAGGSLHPANLLMLVFADRVRRVRLQPRALGAAGLCLA